MDDRSQPTRRFSHVSASSEPELCVDLRGELFTVAAGGCESVSL